MFIDELKKLFNTVKTLRGDNGCPWDKKQTHLSLRKYLLEECHEALEAINEEDHEALQEELGDILLQIMLHSVIAEERENFKLEDVIRGINSKMIRRHPHVFAKSDTNAESSIADIKENWEKIKREEKSKERSILDSIPTTLPALQMCEKILSKAERHPQFGQKIIDYAAQSGFENSDHKLSEKEANKLLISTVYFLREQGYSAEITLNKLNRSLIDQFKEAEKYAED